MFNTGEHAVVPLDRRKIRVVTVTVIYHCTQYKRRVTILRKHSLISNNIYYNLTIIA